MLIKPKKTKYIHIRIDEGNLSIIHQAAKIRGITTSDFIRDTLREVSYKTLQNALDK